MKSAIFHPLAARELGEAAEYYDEARRGLGESFSTRSSGPLPSWINIPRLRPRWGERCGGSSLLDFLTR
jgi:hypothetical protein